MKNCILKALIQYGAILICIIFIGALLLGCVSLLPQEWLFNNIGQSAQMWYEANNPFVFDFSSPSNMLDNYTDSTIILESYYMNSFEAIWSNQHYCDDSPITSLLTVATYSPEPNTLYSRYWGGFRVIYRFLLAFFDVVEIRRIISFSFFSLFFVAAYTFQNKGGIIPAFLFCISVISVKPEVISNSFQYSCCFFITFIAIILLPHNIGISRRTSLYFFAIGCITQFFDFYTTPIITFGFPFCFYLAIKDRDNSHDSIMFLKSAVSWFCGYLMMWIAKLTCTQIFTSEPAFSIAFAQAKSRIGFNKAAGYEDTYNALKALKAVFDVFFQRTSFIVLFILLFFCFLGFCIIVRKKHVYKIKIINSIKSSSIYLCVGGLAIVWYCVAASPTVIHSWFQYRSVSLIVFSVLMFAYHSLCPKN